jgi:hypothetical protein
MTKRALFLLAFPALLALSGCLGDVMEIFCEVGPDSDHCFQTAAIQESEPEDCSKIKGEGFTGTNPPRDKCHMLIAGNTGDPSACEGVEGGMMSYSMEDCLAAAFQNHTVEDCKAAADEAKCRAAWALNGKGCGDGFVWNASTNACEVKKEDAASTTAGGTDDPLANDKVKEDLKTIGDAGKSGYMKLLERDIENEKDPDRLAGLQNYKEFLENAGEKLEEVQTNFETLQELKKIFIDSYDPKDAIENMSASSILAKGFFDRLSEKLMGEDPATPRSNAEDALTVYEAMLEQQKDNDFMQQGRLDRVGETVVSKMKDKATEKLKESAEEIAKGVAGEAFAVVGIVDHALSSFQEEAQKEMFVGLAAAYNRQREAIMQSNPGLSAEEAHKRTVQNVKDNPYEDVTNSGFIKFGNIIENGDCKDAGNNPLCIDNRVFWVAMDKTYEHTHK